MTVTSVVFLFACTKRKCVAPSPEAVLTNLPSLEAKALAKLWLELTATINPKFSAQELYRGASWGIYRRIAEQRPDSVCYAVSAGFGLVSLNTQLPAYEATFSASQDCVAHRIKTSPVQGRVAKHQLWWKEITQHQGSCAGLAEKHPNAQFVFVGGSDYVDALYHDLAALRKNCGKGKIFIISSGWASASRGKLADCVVPATSALEKMLPGARTNLNARILHWLASQVVPSTGWDHTALSREVASAVLECRANASPTPVRASLSDDAVRIYLHKTCEFKTQKRLLTATQALSQLRRNGFSCEEKRFRRLYEKEVAQWGTLQPSPQADALTIL